MQRLITVYYDDEDGGCKIVNDSYIDGLFIDPSIIYSLEKLASNVDASVSAWVADTIQVSRQSKKHTMVTKSEAARLVGVTRQTIHRKINNGELLDTDGKVCTKNLTEVFEA